MERLGSENLSQDVFPGATEIVDRFHVKQHLSEVAKAFYVTDPQRAQRCGGVAGVKALLQVRLRERLHDLSSDW